MQRPLQSHSSGTLPVTPSGPSGPSARGWAGRYWQPQGQGTALHVVTRLCLVGQAGPLGKAEAVAGPCSVQRRSGDPPSPAPRAFTPAPTPSTWPPPQAISPQACRLA